MRIGFIGTGIMGKPMARNLLRAGYPTGVWNRTVSRYTDLAAEGATAYATPSALGAASDTVITMVAGGDDLERVLLGADGALAGMRPGGLFIDMGTTSPERARRIAAACAGRGVDALDAPVSGGENGAIAGTLTIMAGGTAAAFERARPVFAALGKNVTHIGDAGAGQIAKACNQLVVVAAIEAVAEALALAAGSGIDPQKVRDAMLGGSATSRILELHGQRMIDGNYAPGGHVRSHVKDRDNIADAAQRAHLELPLAELVFARITELVARGDGDIDHAALYKLVAPPSSLGSQ